MDTKDKTGPAPIRVAYLNCNDATLFVAEAKLSPAEATKLAAVLAWLEATGSLLKPAEPAASDAPLGFAEIIEGLRASFGDIAVGAALGCDPKGKLGEVGKPVAVMPVFPLCPEGGDIEDRDVLLGTTRLWGAELQVELLRVHRPDVAVPVTTVRPRYQRWHHAGGGGGDRVAVQPPGEEGWYAVAAMSAPSDN
jgi:hypothetical protein